jgi:hypothetical protein
MSEESSPKKLSLVPQPRSTKPTPIVPIMPSSAITDASLSMPHSGGTASIASNVTPSGFTQFEVETICRILVRLAIRMKELNNEAVYEAATTAGSSVQPLGNTNHTRRRKSGYIRQTIHYQPSKIQHHGNGDANR